MLLPPVAVKAAGGSTFPTNNVMILRFPHKMNRRCLLSSGGFNHYTFPISVRKCISWKEMGLAAA